MTSRRDFLLAGAGAFAAPVILRSTDAVASSGVELLQPDSQSPFGLKQASAEAVSASGGIELEDSANGVSRDAYHHTLQIPWRGSFQGALLAAQSVKVPGAVSIQLPSAREIVVIRSTTFWLNAHSRETGANAPRMEVTYNDGSQGVLQCLADSTIDPSSSAPRGYDTRLRLGTAILRFEIPTKTVVTTRLVLQAIAMGGPTSIECREFISPILPEPSPVYGLRARGLAGPTLIHHTDFNAPNWWYPWWTQVSSVPTAAAAANQLTVVDLDTLVPLGRTSYVVETRPAGMAPKPGPLFPGSPAFVFPDNVGKELDEVYFQYRLRLGAGYRGGTMQSGKLPGIASDTSIAGNGGATANGKNGWSFRGLFVGEPMSPASPYNSNAGFVPIGWYTYNPDQIPLHQITGIAYPWTGRGMLGLVEVGTDYWIDQYVKVNTPGKRDGIVRAWINGQLAYERTDHYMRDVPPYEIAGNLGINKVWMTHLHGGQPLPSPTKILRTYFSDWTIATEYIGPPASNASKPPTINIVSPGNGDKLAAGAAISLGVSVVPGGAGISKVDFYRDGTLVATDATAPYGVTLTGVTPGKHVLMAVATDSAKNVSFSSPVTVTLGTLVNAPPAVTITSPREGTTYAEGGSVPIKVYATDDGSITKMVFYLNGNIFSSSIGGSSPWTSSIGGMPIGTYTLKVVATDNQSVTTTVSANFKVAAKA